MSLEDNKKLIQRLMDEGHTRKLTVAGRHVSGLGSGHSIYK